MFFIVWRGWGILAAVFAGAGIFAGVFIAAALAGAGSDTNSQPALLGAGIGAALSAIPIWFVGRRLNSGSDDRVLVDPATGQHVVLRRRHTLFWIPMQWWAIVVVILGLVLVAGFFIPTSPR